MNKKKLIIPMLSYLLINFSPISSAKLRIVIFDLEPIGGISKNTAYTLSAIIRDRLVNCGRFEVLERKSLDDIYREQGISLKSTFDESRRIELGKLLSAEKVVAGYVSRFENNIIINIRLIDLDG